MAQTIQALVPSCSVLGDPVFGDRKAGYLDPACPGATELFCAHKPSRLEHPKVLRHGSEGNGKRVREPRDRSGAQGQLIQNGSSSGVAQRVKHSARIKAEAGH